MVRFSLWKKGDSQSTTDIVPVQEIHIHPRSPPVRSVLKLRNVPLVEVTTNK